MATSRKHMNEKLRPENIEIESGQLRGGQEGGQWSLHLMLSIAVSKYQRTVRISVNKRELTRSWRQDSWKPRTPKGGEHCVAWLLSFLLLCSPPFYVSSHLSDIDSFGENSMSSFLFRRMWSLQRSASYLSLA